MGPLLTLGPAGIRTSSRHACDRARERQGPPGRRRPVTRRWCWALCPLLTPQGSEDISTRDHSMSLVPFCGWQAPAHKAAVRTQQKMQETPWGSGHLEEIIHKRLCKLRTGRESAERYLHSGPARRQASGSQLLTGTVTGMRQKKQRSSFQAKEPALGHPGRRLARCPQADPHRWPVFHSCRDKMDIENLNCHGRRALPFQSELKSP